MNNDQIRGVLDRAGSVLATMFLGWLVTRGYIGQSESAQLLPAVILLPAILWGLWNNRNKSLLQSAAAVVGADGKRTVVIASPELAVATPNDANIISNQTSKATIAAAVEIAKTGESR